MDKEQAAIARLVEASRASERFYQQPLVVTHSGGKDSCVLVDLALKAGIDFEVLHNHTTADAPETFFFLKDEFKRLEEKGVPCTRSFPTYKGKPTSMWNLIPKKLMPPTRIIRYCCEILKERGGQHRYIATGVRWDESTRRRNTRGIYEASHKSPEKRIVLMNDNDDRRRLFETCILQHKAICNPIIDWTNTEIWDYIRSEHIAVNPLYECGFSRVGCIGCPMARLHGRQKEFAFWPGYKRLYIWSFDRMLEKRRQLGKIDRAWRSGATGEEIFHWWMQDGILPGQMEIEGWDVEDTEGE